MKIHVLSLFPEMFTGVFGSSILKKAQEKGAIELAVTDIRDFSENKHKQVDDYPYGGGAGMVLKPEPGKILREKMPKTFILVPGYGAQGGKGADLVHFFNKDGLGAIINSSRGIIAAYTQEKYASYGDTGYADAARAAVLAMKEDIVTAVGL